MKSRMLLLAAAVLVTAPTVSNAALIDAGTYTTDTATGLDWLDLTASSNLSYNYVSSQFGSGGLFEGWRYATSAETEALLQNLGFTIGYSVGAIGSAPAGYAAALTNLVNLFGDTLATSGPSYRGALGLTSQVDAPGSHRRLGAYTESFGAIYWLETSGSSVCCQRVLGLLQHRGLGAELVLRKLSRAELSQRAGARISSACDPRAAWPRSRPPSGPKVSTDQNWPRLCSRRKSTRWGTMT